MNVTPENTDTIIKNMRSEGSQSRADYLELMSQRLAEAEAKLPRWIPYTEGDRVEDGNYLISVCGEVTEASYETSKDPNVFDSGFFDECGGEYIPDAYMKKPTPYNPYDLEADA